MLVIYQNNMLTIIEPYAPLPTIDPYQYINNYIPHFTCSQNDQNPKITYTTSHVHQYTKNYIYHFTCAQNFQHTHLHQKSHTIVAIHLINIKSSNVNVSKVSISITISLVYQMAKTQKLHTPLHMCTNTPIF
jgi:hypothetical protein